MTKALVKHLVSSGHGHLSLVALSEGKSSLLVTVPHEGAEIFRGEPEEGRTWLPGIPGDKDGFHQIEFPDEMARSIATLLAANERISGVGIVGLFRSDVIQDYNRQQTLEQIRQNDL